MIEVKRLPNEPSRPYSALCAFAQLGPKRSLPRAARQLELPVATLRGWSGRYRWTVRTVGSARAPVCRVRRLAGHLSPFLDRLDRL